MSDWRDAPRRSFVPVFVVLAVFAIASCSARPTPTAAPGIAPAQARTDTPYQDRHGSDACTQDCSGHEAGYRWAEAHGIVDASDCGGNSQSFREGCQAYARDHGVSGDGG
jgi:hypothetical protein